MQHDDRLASARSRSQLFWLIADGLLKGLLTEPWSAATQAVVGQDHGYDIDDRLDSAWRDLIDVLGHAGTGAGNRLAIEHTRLFSGLAEGSGPPPPFESVWRNSKEPGEIALSVTRAYDEAGFADIDVSAGPQDHLAVELKFMALLALREAEAWDRAAFEAAEDRIRQQQVFLDHHLLQWVPRWIDQVAQMTQEPVYWAFAGLISASLVRAAEDLGVVYN